MSAAGSGGNDDSDSGLQPWQPVSRIPKPVPRRQARHRLVEDNIEDASEVPKSHELPISRPLLYQPPDTRVCYFYRDGNSNAAPVKLVVNRRVYPTVDNLKDELTRRVDGLPFGVRGIYTPAGRDAVRSLSDLRHDGRYVCTTVAARARGVDVQRADAFGGQVWRAGARPGSDGQRTLNAMLRGGDEHSPHVAGRRDGPDGVDRRLAWGTIDSEHSGKPAASNQLTSRSPKKIVVCHFDTTEKQTLLLYKRTPQTFEQVLGDLSDMFKAPVRKMFTVDGTRVDSHFSYCQISLKLHLISMTFRFFMALDKIIIISIFVIS